MKPIAPFMNEHTNLNGLIGAEESTRLMGQLQRGANRRDVLAMLMAGGMQAALAASVATLAGTAHAQTPRKGGRIRRRDFHMDERPHLHVRDYHAVAPQLDTGGSRVQALGVASFNASCCSHGVTCRRATSSRQIVVA